MSVPSTAPGSPRARVPGRFRLLTASLLLAASAAAAQESGTEPRLVSGSFSAGLSQSFLDIESQRECETCGSSVVEYETEGVNILRLLGTARLWDVPVLEFKLERPFRSSPNQSELLRSGGAERSSYEEFVGSVMTRPLIERLLSGETPGRRLVRRLLSPRLTVTREAFFGLARPKADALFLPRSATIDYAAPSITGATPVSAGEALSFKTLFSDNEVSVALFEAHPAGSLLADGALRFGWYWATWERLSDIQVPSLSSSHLIHEVAFETRGLSAAFEPLDPTAPGLNVELGAKVGLSDRVKSAIDWDRVSGSETVVQTRMLRLGAWYNHLFGGADGDRWRLTAGGSADLRETKIKKGLTAAEVTPLNDHRDLILKYFVSAGWQF